MVPPFLPVDLLTAFLSLIIPFLHTITAWPITNLPNLLLTKPKQVCLSYSAGNNVKAKKTEIYSQRWRIQ